MTFGINDLKPAPGSTHGRKRLGRGRSSGSGKTSGRGMKGQKARGQTRVGFEGGQMPLQRRIPKLRGFKPRDKKYYTLINVELLNAFTDGEIITPQVLQEKKLIKKPDEQIKILGRGELKKELTVKAHAFSQSAREKIEGAGGSIEVV
ncbi:MAG: 50S ribosomal protein L15 [Actinobacteria bacterium RBG_19FT_COMBO_54_7]|uniref:Large ribosomal subunit protein uL15 n=1 Tax=Candidatus Solincola sediminis TaxID=1797199 RepID=A0A1F2WI32_9ACTN|nr:MAG: 50S ribosomal protein L15 [Candidatus Solincola sediminis]OFW59833.1 MAG: 50S ribosomal protein L15 [Candidatus Solincola sediminis]OFW65164.1 MAG: 50S ribosomal protein L15 [Actinobacteria bacterium RBG_19FT_COMBO_54_7]